MKKILIISLISFKIYAGDLESYHLTIESQIESEKGVETIISAPDSKYITVKSDSELTDFQHNLIGVGYETFFNWDELEIESSQMVFEDSKLSIIINPKTLNYNSISMVEYLPSGIQFYYDSFFEYDFRMSKDHLFMRLKGQFYSKEEFLEELYNAYIDPILYIQVHDPSYLIRQIDELRKANLEQKKMIEIQQDQIANLLLAYHDLNEKHNMLSDGVISLNNSTFLGSVLEFNQQDVAAVVNIKNGNLEISVKEVVSTLKSEGIKVTSKFVESVFMIYFREFPQNK